MKFKLPNLPYSSAALEPFIDRRTMIIHHGRHHQAYVDKLNQALTQHSELKTSSIEEVLTNTHLIPEDIHSAVINFGGGHANHSLFWQIMSPGADRKPTGNLLSALNNTFGSTEVFKEKFTQFALGLFGSGWTWLTLSPDKKLKIYSLPNQDSPLSKGEIPLLTLDLWEHAYYLKYQNSRPDYIAAWWNVVNWKEVSRRYNLALEK